MLRPLLGSSRNPVPRHHRDAERSEWIVYALAHGKSAEQLEDVRTATIADWYLGDEQ
ncbi:hypothetical protein ACQPW1_47390 [Nocardia sp. CA-128927]|uniref:hypothetical protein n=1 Tax=Nocardia sp. CA-128927 TaxID=3239975 RepID=UPI003D98C34F